MARTGARARRHAPPPVGRRQRARRRARHGLVRALALAAPAQRGCSGRGAGGAMAPAAALTGPAPAAARAAGITRARRAPPRTRRRTSGPRTWRPAAATTSPSRGRTPAQRAAGSVRRRRRPRPRRKAHLHGGQVGGAVVAAHHVQLAAVRHHAGVAARVRHGRRRRPALAVAEPKMIP